MAGDSTNALAKMLRKHSCKQRPDLRDGWLRWPSQTKHSGEVQPQDQPVDPGGSHEYAEVGC